MGMRCFTTAQKVAYAVGFVVSIATIPLVIGLPMLYYLARAYFRKRDQCRLMEEQAKLVAGR